MRKQLSIKSVPDWAISIQCICFGILYTIWGLPETILIRHLCLIIGALIGVYEIYLLRIELLSKNKITVWLLGILFLWVTFHLIFLSNDFQSQYDEYTTIWKRTIIGVIFALGLGLAIANQNIKNAKFYWWIFYFGLLGPSIIYIIKWISIYIAQSWGITLPEYLKLYTASATFYIPKTTYVCFCTPALAVALGMLSNNINKSLLLYWSNLIYFITIITVLFIFFSENIKNGIVYSIFLIIVFMLTIFKTGFKTNLFKKFILLFSIIIIVICFVHYHLYKNPSWATLYVDAKIAININQYDQWKFDGTKGYPENEYGSKVSRTNYDRIAWAKVATNLLIENPLGYGLIERSFGRLTKEKWPESILHQSHSGWLDLALGIGIIGVSIIILILILLLKSTVIILFNSTVNNKKNILINWLVAVWWINFSILLIWCTTEISQKVFFDSLIFWIAISIGLSSFKEKVNQ